MRGVDLSEEMIRAATAKVGLDPEGRIAFKQGDAADLPFLDESFDLVAQLDMPPFFAEIARVLRPGGHCRRRLQLGRPDPLLHATGPAALEVPPVRDRAGRDWRGGHGTSYVGRLAATG